MKILFVCSSNVCRSPYCEFMLRRMVAGDDVLSRAGIEISSSAVLNHSKEIFPKAVVALKNEGFSEEELLRHKPSHKSNARDRFEEADIIIGMSRFHKLLTPASCRSKYITLSEVAEGKYTPIPDPWLKTSQADYDKSMAVLKKYLDEYFVKLKAQFAK